jgi:hypothetical protein
MIKGITYTKKRGVVALAAAGAALMAIFVRVELHRETLNERRRALARDHELSRLIEGRSDYNGAHLEALRRKVSQFRMKLGEDGAWDLILKRLHTRWIAESGTATDREDYTVRSGIFRMGSPAPSDWAEILETVQYIEGIPGASVAELKMKSGGIPHASLNFVSMLIVVRTSRSGQSLSSL